ncbi:glycoside hydrolase family 44 protein [soil metagenome]
MILFALTLLQTPAIITVDTRVQTPISPYIYGVNYPDNWIYEWIAEWNLHHDAFSFAREGGNRFTAYNWETNASNAGNDYFHENDDYLAMSKEPGWTVRQFLKFVQGAGAAALITVPTLGYVAADKDTNMNGDKDVIKTPDYLNVRFHKSYATNPNPTTTPDLNDKAVYQSDFVAWVQKVKSPKTPVWFSLDNEPDLWNGTHKRIHPGPLSYAEIIGNNIEYASMIKANAPDSLVFGPANYGWQGLRTFQGAPDGNGRDFMETYLDSMREASKKAGHRLVDVYDFHYYPETKGEGGRIIYGRGPEKPSVATARIQAPRSLWDPTFVEDSWITQSRNGKPVMLITDTAGRIKAHYPGTKMAITEYEFGGPNTISGALAQADALGVFGRYGIFAASHWGVSSVDKATYSAFQAFTNYDRNGSRFGDLGLRVTGETPSNNSVYASLSTTNKNCLTLVVINKQEQATPMQINLSGFSGKAIKAFTITDKSYETGTNTPATLQNGAATLTIPALSITTIEVRK